ncbi:MAG TPA: biopolymer transporter ExbD [Candidatus Binatia bacterium]|nr:biopolymer transporter ExbD [Candidatus Binatia bacterium]
MAALARRERAYALPHAEPNVIPFIDVLLVLLIIFMVTAPRPTTDLQVDLPRPGRPIAIVIPPTIVQISAAPSGYRIFMSGTETTLGRLGDDAVAHLLAADPALTTEDVLAEGRIFVRADLDVAYQHVITVVETLQDARFRRVAIYAQDADASGQ